MSGESRFGLDVGYFKRELKKLSASLDNRPPDELSRYLIRLANVATPPGFEMVPEGTMAALEAISSQVAACALAVDEGELTQMLENCGKLADAILTAHRATQKKGE